MPPVIYFIRHGETDWNAEARLQGQTDIPLNGLGRKQAAEAGAILRDATSGYRELDYVASPLDRTRQTMEILRDTLGLPPAQYRMDSRLKELTFGRWEGLTWKEVRRKDPSGASAREEDKWNMVPPGGESYAMLVQRVAPLIEELTRECCIVAHGGVARALMVLIGGIDTDDAPTRDIWQGKVLKFADGKADWI